MTLRAEAFLDDRKRMVVVSFYDYEAPVGRVQRGECDGYRPPANWPFNLVPYRMTPEGAR